MAKDSDDYFVSLSSFVGERQLMPAFHRNYVERFNEIAILSMPYPRGTVRCTRGVRHVVVEGYDFPSFAAKWFGKAKKRR